MSRSSFDSPSKRAKLEPRRNPYWQGISGGRGGVSLGYRRTGRGPGGWIGKIVDAGRRVEERIASADDEGSDDGSLDYRAAVGATLEWAKQRFAAIESERAAFGSGSSAPTVGSVLIDYSKARQAEDESGRYAKNSLRRHALSDEVFAGIRLNRLAASDILAWREQLPATLKKSTVNRILNDVRAALNAAASRYHRELPTHLLGEIKKGTKAHKQVGGARRQILSEADVCNLVAAAFEVDQTGDFGRFTAAAAATGARPSQLARLQVNDLQLAAERLMMPVSRKGIGEKSSSHLAIALGTDVLEVLAEVAGLRDGNEPLLMHWLLRQISPFEWERVRRTAWNPTSYQRLWLKIRDRCGVPPTTTFYALRHTSIVRCLRKGLPIRIVAAQHDTSSAMIEKHYAAFILDATEELTRRAIVPIVVGKASKSIAA